MSLPGHPVPSFLSTRNHILSSLFLIPCYNVIVGKCHDEISESNLNIFSNLSFVVLLLILFVVVSIVRELDGFDQCIENNNNKAINYANCNNHIIPKSIFRLLCSKYCFPRSFRWQSKRSKFVCHSYYYHSVIFT